MAQPLLFLGVGRKFKWLLTNKNVGPQIFQAGDFSVKIVAAQASGDNAIKDCRPLFENQA